MSARIVPTVWIFPASILQQKMPPIHRTVWERHHLSAVVEDLKAVLSDKDAAGVASNQIGHYLRVCVYRRLFEDIVLCEPEISNPRGEVVSKESCLSLPGKKLDVKRAKVIHVLARDVTGNYFEFEAQDDEAVVIQHEVDHLNGILISDPHP